MQLSPSFKTFEFNKINNMNISYKNWFKGGLLSIATIVGVTACSDDHFDIVVSGEAEGKTLWQNIQENENLTDFARVLSATSYLKSDMDFPSGTQAKMTYAEYLNSPQSLTVWAPINGSFNADSLLVVLDSIKGLYADSREVATKAEYIFAAQFLGQHIARFNHEVQGEDKRVRMLNSKYVVYDASAKTFDGIPFIAEGGSCPSSNGTLHVLPTPSKYAYNIFDYLSSDASLSLMYSIISDKKYEITSFAPGSSTQGAINNEGKMEYVDSVYSNYNTLLNQANAQLKNEDSVYVAVFPTNDAYQDALDLVKSMFKYKQDESYKNLANAAEATWTESDKLIPGQFNYDSLQTLNAERLLLSSMYFSPSVMGERVSASDSASIIDYCLYNDSVNTTNWKTIYNSNKGGKNPFFLGANNEDVNPIKVSNGYIFPVNHYNLDLAYSFLQRYEVGINVLGVGTNAAYKTWALSTDVKNDSTVVDPWKIKSFTRVSPATPNRDMDFQLTLPALKSGRYKVYAIILPSAIHSDLGENMKYTEKLTFDVTIFDDSAKELINRKGVTAPNDSVKKVVLFDDWTLEHSYDGLPEGTNSFPYLKIQLPKAYQQDRRTGKTLCEGINLYKIVIEPYREDSTNE